MGIFENSIHKYTYTPTRECAYLWTNRSCHLRRFHPHSKSDPDRDQFIKFFAVVWFETNPPDFRYLIVYYQWLLMRKFRISVWNFEILLALNSNKNKLKIQKNRSEIKLNKNEVHFKKEWPLKLMHAVIKRKHKVYILHLKIQLPEESFSFLDLYQLETRNE